jgi:hypothetical protein
VGKAAKNEKIKLRAIHFNNISVGFMLAGMVIPLLSVFSSEWILSDNLFPEDWRRVAVAVGTILTATTAAMILRGHALKILDELED